MRAIGRLLFVCALAAAGCARADDPTDASGRQPNRGTEDGCRWDCTSSPCVMQCPPDMPTLPPPRRSGDYLALYLGDFFPNRVTATGQMAGSVLDKVQIAARGRVGSIRRLTSWSNPMPLLIITAMANGQQDDGLTVGYATIGDIEQEAVRWDASGAMHSLGLQPGGIASAATDINSSGFTVGYGAVGWAISPLYWDAGGIHTLPSVGNGAATAVNDKGLIAGYSNLDDGKMHAVIWDTQRKLVDLGVEGNARAINGEGVVVGTANSGGHAFRWTESEGVVRLPNPTGLGMCMASSVNSQGQIVGSCNVPGDAMANHAVLWNNGDAIDLNNVVANPGWVLESASSISSTGLIVGSGRFAGQRCGFMLVPTSPSP